MDTPRDNRGNSEKQDFLDLFSDHLDSEITNGLETVSVDDSSPCTYETAPETNDSKTCCPEEGNNLKPDASETRPSALQDAAGDTFSVEDDGEALQNLIPVKRPSTTDKNGRANVSLVVGDLSRTGPLAEMIARQTVAHWLQVCRDEDAYMFCNKEAYSIIWILVTLPANQDLLSLTTSIRYFSKFNKETAVIGISPNLEDVDLRLHGIDEIVLQPITQFIIQHQYEKWTLVKVNPDALKENTLQKHLFPVIPVSGTTNFFELPIPLKTLMPLKEISKPQEISKPRQISKPQQISNVSRKTQKNSLNPKQDSFNLSLFQREHTAKEKLRRERIKESCDQLRVLLPYVRGRKTDMASILERCVEYLKLINALLPTETRRQIMDVLHKDFVMHGRTVKGGPNNKVGSVMFPQSNDSNHSTTITKSTMLSSRTLFQSDSGKSSQLLNDPGRPNLLNASNEAKSSENTKRESVDTEETIKDSSLQCSAPKRPRLNEPQSLDDYLSNPSEQSNHTHRERNLLSSLFSRNMHNRPLIATDLRKNSTFIGPCQFAPDTAHPSCSRMLVTKAANSIPMNTELSMPSHFPVCPLKPPQQAHNQLQHDNRKVINKTNPLVSSHQSYHYHTGIIPFGDPRLHPVYPSSVQARYRSNYAMRTYTRLPVSQLPKTRISTNFQSLPLMNVMVGCNTTASCVPSIHPATIHKPTTLSVPSVHPAAIHKPQFTTATTLCVPRAHPITKYRPESTTATTSCGISVHPATIHRPQSTTTNALTLPSVYPATINKPQSTTATTSCVPSVHPATIHKPQSTAVPGVYPATIFRPEFTTVTTPCMPHVHTATLHKPQSMTKNTSCVPSVHPATLHKPQFTTETTSCVPSLHPATIHIPQSTTETTFCVPSVHPATIHKPQSMTATTSCVPSVHAATLHKPQSTTKTTSCVPSVHPAALHKPQSTTETTSCVPSVHPATIHIPQSTTETTSCVPSVHPATLHIPQFTTETTSCVPSVYPATIHIPQSTTETTSRVPSVHPAALHKPQSMTATTPCVPSVHPATIHIPQSTTETTSRVPSVHPAALHKPQSMTATTPCVPSVHPATIHIPQSTTETTSCVPSVHPATIHKPQSTTATTSCVPSVYPATIHIPQSTTETTSRVPSVHPAALHKPQSMTATTPCVPSVHPATIHIPHSTTETTSRVPSVHPAALHKPQSMTATTPCVPSVHPATIHIPQSTTETTSCVPSVHPATIHKPQSTTETTSGVANVHPDTIHIPQFMTANTSYVPHVLPSKMHRSESTTTTTWSVPSVPSATIDSPESSSPTTSSVSHVPPAAIQRLESTTATTLSLPCLHQAKIDRDIAEKIT